MIDEVEIRNFQSLKNVKLDLSKFTVIVGASSSGKSAFLRALKALATNPRTSSFVTYGKTLATVQARLGDDTVTLEKGEGHTVYKLIKEGKPFSFAKLGGLVPDQVAEALGRPDTNVNFADQFDRPYLLDDTGSSVARVLGDLTNVSSIFEAVREANRRKASAASTLKTREKDIGEIRDQVKSYAGLKEKLGAVDEATSMAEEAESLGYRILYLQGLVDDLEMAEQVLSRTLVIEDLPDYEEIQRLQTRRDAFVSLIIEWRQAVEQCANSEDAIGYYELAEQEAHDELHEYLVEVGECPTCHQPVH